MVHPLKRIAMILVISILLLFWIATPAVAGNAASNSGNGMNRQGSPSTHPGNGWKDPGSWQGSPKNTADPDCTGNRTKNPQPTNKGACDNPSGAADKPGGTGGFDSDKDWNNGCGNDTDFEDDNNGNCGGRKAPEVQKPPPPKQQPPKVAEEPKIEPKGEDKERPPPKPAVVQPPPGGPIVPTVATRPTVVLAEEIPRPVPVPLGQRMPVTGLDSMDLFMTGLLFIVGGRLMLVRTRRGGR